MNVSIDILEQAEADKKYIFKNLFNLKYDDEELEGIRVKCNGEDGCIQPKVVDLYRVRFE